MRIMAGSLCYESDPYTYYHAGLHVDVDVDITITEASSFLQLPMSSCQQQRGPMGTAYAV